MSLLLVCTDRDTHPARQLGWLLREQTPDGPVMVYVAWAPKADLHRRDRPVQRGTVRPKPCPTCRRTVPMRQETAARCYDTLTEAGIPFDVSRVG